MALKETGHFLYHRHREFPVRGGGGEAVYNLGRLGTYRVAEASLGLLILLFLPPGYEGYRCTPLRLTSQILFKSELQ